MKKHKFVKKIAEGEYLGLARSAAPVVPAHNFKLGDRVVINTEWADWEFKGHFKGDVSAGDTGTVVKREEWQAERDDLVAVEMDKDFTSRDPHQFHMKFLSHLCTHVLDQDKHKALFPKVGEPGVHVNPERDTMGTYPNGYYDGAYIYDIELEAQNVGSEITARKLGDIARGGEHKGGFGGIALEATAQCILTMRKVIDVQAKTLAVYADQERLRGGDLLHGWAGWPAQERQTEWSTNTPPLFGGSRTGDYASRATSEQGTSVPQADGDSSLSTLAPLGGNEKTWIGTLAGETFGRDDAATESEHRVSLGRQVDILAEREEMYRMELSTTSHYLGDVDLDQVAKRAREVTEENATLKSTIEIYKELLRK